ncbi:MAG: AsmA family protein [Bacteroidales bacterium]|nr:AsmA family protein [Bacteroidales bacterium]
MKKFLKVLAIFIAVVFALILILPFFFKAEIVKLVKSELNKQLTATIDFEDASLSMIRQFPDFTLDLNGLSVIGQSDFENDTLLYAKALSLRIDVVKAFRGSFELKEFNLDKPKLKLKVLENGKVNWDIVAASSAEPATTADPDAEAFVLQLKKLSLKDAEVVYDDRELKMRTTIKGVNASVRGALSTDQSEISTNLTIDKLNVNYEGVSYLSNVKAKFQAIFLVDLKNEIYTFKNNTLYLNDLSLGFDGSVGINSDQYTILLNFETENTAFKQLLSLVPVVYASSFESIKTEGTFSLKGFVKGAYSETQMPAYGLDLQVKNASFKYPELPVGINGINGKANIESKTGQPDDTKIDVSEFKFKVADQPFALSMTLSTPVSDPNFSLMANGTLDFKQISQILPPEYRSKMEGRLNADLRLKAKMSDLENERFNQINASGSLLLQDFILEDKSMFSLPVAISNAQLNFSPIFVDLINTQLVVGQSDFGLNGRLDNYLAYYLSGGTLVGQLNLKSKKVNVDELMQLMVEEDSATAEMPADTAAVSTEFPERLKLSFAAKIDSVLYNPYKLANVTANVDYEQKRLNFNPLSADLLQGKMSMKGSFDAKQAEKPKVNINFVIQNFDIPEAYKTIGLLQEAAPIAENASGSFSTSFNLKGQLDKAYDPVYESLEGGGTLQTSQLQIENINSLKKIGNLLGQGEKYDRLVTDGLNFSFEFVNGRVYQKPFDIKIGNNNALVSGSIGFDKTLDYDMVFGIPFSELGGTIQSGLQQLTQTAADNNISISGNETIKVKAKITGLVDDPKVSIDYKDYASDLGKQLKDQANRLIEEQKQALKDKVDAEAQKLLQQAEEQAAQLVSKAKETAASIREEGKKAAQSVKAEAETQANNLIAEGKKNGMIAELAAKKAAEKVRSEANKQANNIETEANKRADQLVTEAQQKADKIMEEARNKIQP